MLRIDDNGVSPVVGVMLMLVVTIVIAALVSAFAGGLKASDATPSMTFDGKFSVENGMILTHTGGDTLSTKQINILIRPGKGFGIAGSGQTNYGTFSAEIVNKSLVTDKDKNALINLNGLGGKSTWELGESLFIFPPYHTVEYLQPGVYISGMQTSAIGFAQPTSIGKTIIVELIDDKGHLFTSREIPIVA